MLGFMTNEEFVVVKSEIINMMDTLRLRGVLVTPIHDLLSPIITLPKIKRWENVRDFFEERQYSPVETDIMRQVYNILKDKILTHLLFSHKLVKILEVNEETFDTLLQYFQAKITKNIDDFAMHQLISGKSFKDTKFRYDLTPELESYISKSIVDDSLKINIENRVSKKLQREFIDIYGVKKVQYHSLNHVVFDKKNKVIFLAVDLAGIAKESNVQKNLDKLSIAVKSTVKRLTFPDHSRNLFAKIRYFYDNEPHPASYASKLFFKTPDGLTYTSHANQLFPDGRRSHYHVKGEIAVGNTLSFYRILKGFNTVRRTSYTIELASNPKMTTKPKPELYVATISATNKEDFAEALQKLL